MLRIIGGVVLPLQLTVELGVLVPYPDEGREAKDHLRPSALRMKRVEERAFIFLSKQRNWQLYYSHFTTSI